ncbi:MAG: flagellar hook-basal body complex protein FliE [Treponema sp.]|jgi:flagellar hook-basal body complex protein FliE|nr:flagellar hook-basal body complex protein FliE [Treponema sp.]
MTIYRPELLAGGNIPLTITNPKHLVPKSGDYSAQGTAISILGNSIGADAVTGSGVFEDAMLKALDAVSADQQFSATLTQAAITDPNSVDVHDITIAQAKAQMSLNIARTVLNRIVQGWKDIINTR